MPKKPRGKSAKKEEEWQGEDDLSEEVDGLSVSSGKKKSKKKKAEDPEWASKKRAALLGLDDDGDDDDEVKRQTEVEQTKYVLLYTLTAFDFQGSQFGAGDVPAYDYEYELTLYSAVQAVCCCLCRCGPVS